MKGFVYWTAGIQAFSLKSLAFVGVSMSFFFFTKPLVNKAADVLKAGSISESGAVGMQSLKEI